MTSRDGHEVGINFTQQEMASLFAAGVAIKSRIDVDKFLDSAIEKIVQARDSSVNLETKEGN